MEGVTCRVVFESINQFGQVERHIHHTSDIEQARKDEAALQNRMNWMTARDKDPEHDIYH